MKTYSNCECCGSDLEPREVFTPCYDAPGGSVDSFDVCLQYPSYPYCEGCDDYVPQECKDPLWIAKTYEAYTVEDDDTLPF